MTGEPSDEALMLRFAERNDAQAFGLLVARHKDELVRYAARFLGDHHAGEDVAQEAFVRVFRNAASFDGSRNFAAWLYSIAGNLCRNETRNSRLRPLGMGSLPEVPSFAPPGPADDIRKAFARLPDAEREALMLREFHGMRYLEIAEAMEAPVGSVRGWIHRGRLRLREELEKEARS